MDQSKETDNDNSEGKKRAIKSFLKSMPSWEDSDRLDVELKKFQHEFEDYVEKLGNRIERIDLLKRPNAPTASAPPKSQGDKDLVEIYDGLSADEPATSKKSQAEPRASSSKSNDKPVKGPIKDEHVLKLEEKIKAHEEVYAMINSGKPWVKCKIICVVRRPAREGLHNRGSLIRFRIRTLNEETNRILDVDKFSIARLKDHLIELKASKRVIAGPDADNLKPGIIGQEPSIINNHRYLVLMDDSSAIYYKQDQIYPIFGQSATPWRDARHTGCDDRNTLAYLKYFFRTYPKRYLMKTHNGEKIEVFVKGNLVPAAVTGEDCDVITVAYGDGSQESIYRGSARLLRKAEIISHQLANSNDYAHFHNGLLTNMQLYYKASIHSLNEDLYNCFENQTSTVIVSSKHNTARKSTASSIKRFEVHLDGRTLGDNAIKTFDPIRVSQMRSHKCDEACLDLPGIRTETSVEDMIDEFRDISDLKVPLLLGWKRELTRVNSNTRSGRGKYSIVYEAPCKKVFQQPFDVKRYLIRTKSRLDLDYFSFDREVNLDRKLGVTNAVYFVENIAVDKNTGRPLENKLISLLNTHDEEQLPIDFEYRNETFPHPLLKAKNFSFNRDFKSSCECEDDCFSRATCDCHKLNEDSFGSLKYNRGTVDTQCQYSHKRLNAQVNTGIFECNSWCNCSSKCSNRVVQNGIRFRLQVRKTVAKGWGVVTLDDIPSGAFICTYSAELLDDADQYGDSDMYYADLDYITVLESQKLAASDDEKSDEGVEVGENDNDEQPNGGKRKKCNDSSSSDEGLKNNDSSSSSEDANEDVVMRDYVPNEPPQERYPKRKTRASHQQPRPRQKGKARDDANRPLQQFKRIHDLLSSHDYTLDARMQGNIGRFFNHSCDPNSIVQNVFIETHDLRFPVVAFFANRTIKAGNEITWNYNYKMGSIEGREMKCECAAPNCRGRIL